MATPRPSLAVVVVSDYGGRTDGDWGYLRATLGALGRQTCDEAVDVVLVDSTSAEERMPADLIRRVPRLRVLCDASATTSELLDAAVRSTSAGLVAFLDGDCVPVPGWAEAAVRAMRANPDAAVVSGRTVYPDRGLLFRMLGLLSRSYLDPGRAGRTTFVSSYNAVFRRDVLCAHPLGPMRRSMASRLQAEAIRRAGGAFYFEPAMRVTHRFDGWPMERRIRRRVGYRAVRLRQLEPRTPHAWMVQLGPLSIPAILAARVFESWMNCLRVGRQYGVRWFELPAAFATAVGLHLLEIGGMREAFAEDRTAPPGVLQPRHEGR